jgi:hypothetical protein
MTSPRLTLAYSGQASEREALDLLLIEQEDWRPYTGVVTLAGMVGYLAALLYGEDYQDRIDCGLTGGEVVCAVFVYPRRAGLVYQFHASHGSLSERQIEEIEIEEGVNFSLSNRATPQYPPLAIALAEWLDAVYDVAGNLIPPPALTIHSGEIHSAVPCYGSVQVRYTTERHSYILTAPRRDDGQTIDNYYSAVVYGVYSGGINWLEIEMPPGIATFESDPDANCGWGSVDGSISRPDDEEQPVQPRPKNRHTVIDYCSQETASDNFY